MSASEHLEGVTITPEATADWAQEVSALADAALHAGADVELTDPTNEYLFHLNVVDDSSPAGSWVDRIRLYFAGRLVSWFNEYGEFRVMPAKINTVAFRIFAALNSAELANRNPENVVFEIVDERTNRNRLVSVNHFGETYIRGGLTVDEDIDAPNIGVPIRGVLDHDETPVDPLPGDIYLVRPE